MKKRFFDPLSPRRFVLLCAWGVMVASASPAQTPQNYAALVRRVAPSVITVIVEDKHVGAGALAAEQASAENNGNDVGAAIRRLLTGSLGPPDNERPTGSLGSGFVIRGDGLIVTNRHVVNAALKVRVRLPDGREVPAKVLGSDAVTDIALLKVDVANLQALHLGTSQSVSVGDPVIAIGNPFGLGQSVSAGIISARSRTLEDDPYIDFFADRRGHQSRQFGRPTAERKWHGRGSDLSHLLAERRFGGVGIRDSCRNRHGRHRSD